MRGIKISFEILLSLILLTVCSALLLRSIVQDTIELSIANDSTARDSITSALKLYDFRCPENTFECGLGYCISKYKLCDGYSDCPNNSDEELLSCFSDISTAVELLRPKREDFCDFYCDSGECLESNFVCDGLPNCADNSDETEKICANIICSSFLFRCKYGACILKNNVCDGEANCADLSDEETLECVEPIRAGLCKNFEFRCVDGGCIDKSKVCDGFTNCVDGSDETIEVCSDISCPKYLFKCSYGACVVKDARCNNLKECVDGSDEVNCNVNTLHEIPLTNKSYGCILPKHPVHGEYEIKPVKIYLEGSYASPGTNLHLKCSTGYVPFILFSFTCSYNLWYPTLNHGRCLRTCSPLHLSATYSMHCSLNGQSINCINSVEGTEASISCKSNDSTMKINSILVCLSNGSWSQELKSCEASEELGSSCVLPPHPRHGKYNLVSGQVYEEGGKTSSDLIMLVCDTTFVSADKYLEYFKCHDGQWFPKIQKEVCISTCPSLNDTVTYNVKCRLHGRKVECDNPVVNTTADLICERFYKSNAAKVILSCQNGQWNPPPTPCYPECGMKIVNAGPLVIGGESTMEAEYPWVVAIYNKSNNNQYICSGSIISRMYILSAAHCFTDAKGTPYKKDSFIIVAGKYYRKLVIKENDTQIRKVKNIFIHGEYKGHIGLYNHDIALIQVDDQFKLTEKVQLVCLDWANKMHVLPEGTMAVVMGWGYTKEGSLPSEVLKKLVVRIRSKATCKAHRRDDYFRIYYTQNKICAGYHGMGKSVCNGDSGGGLYIQDESGYFIIGITSMTPKSHVGCDSNYYAFYTNIKKYIKWITKITYRRL